jgi:hypothetical protein
MGISRYNRILKKQYVQNLFNAGDLYGGVDQIIVEMSLPTIFALSMFVQT